MAIKAGVWIDHRQASVVLINGADCAVTKLVVSAEPGAKKFTPNDFVPEDRRERKLAIDRQKMYDEVLTCIRGAEALLIFGPGDAKGELKKHLAGKKIRGLAVEVEASDKLTDRQIVAKVQGHFAPTAGKPQGRLRKVIASNTAAPKKVAKKKAAAKPVTKPVPKRKKK